MKKNKNIGKCYLVGAGPGDPTLLTIKAKSLIQTAEVLVVDNLVNQNILNFAPQSASIIYAGKIANKHFLSQDEINTVIVKSAQMGKTVVRLKGGDPFMFGRGGEELEELAKHKIYYEIVPGISSAIAGPASIGIPVTHRDHNTALTIFTGHLKSDETNFNLKKIANADGTKVMLMGMNMLTEITKKLISLKIPKNTPVAVIQWASTHKQKHTTSDLENIAQKCLHENISAPAVVVIGNVVNLHKYHIKKEKPLHGKRIVITRTRKQSSSLSEKLSKLGADIIEMPLIKICPPDNQAQFIEFVENVHTYNWLVFTSPNAVEAFFEKFYQIYPDARSIGAVEISAIGPSTANMINKYHFACDVIAKKHIAEGLVKAIENHTSIENLTFLWVKAKETRDVVSDLLSKKGAIVDTAIAYQTIPETKLNKIAIQNFKNYGADIITFASSSAVENFVKLKLPLPKNLKIASIGPITSQSVKANGLDIDIEAKDHNIDGLVESILNHFKNK